MNTVELQWHSAPHWRDAGPAQAALRHNNETEQRPVFSKEDLFEEPMIFLHVAYEQRGCRWRKLAGALGQLRCWQFRTASTRSETSALHTSFSRNWPGVLNGRAETNRG
jgi:hypothetical protein